MQEERKFGEKGIPKSWQDKRILRHIRRCYQLNERGLNKKLKSALCLYGVLTELASNNKQVNTFCATYKTMAKMMGVSYSTVRRYTDEFIKVKILKKEFTKNGKKNYANKWTLLEYAPMTLSSVHNNEQGAKNSMSSINDKASIQIKDLASVQDIEQD